MSAIQDRNNIIYYLSNERSGMLTENKKLKQENKKLKLVNEGLRAKVKYYEDHATLHRSNG